MVGAHSTQLSKAAVGPRMRLQSSSHEGAHVLALQLDLFLQGGALCQFSSCQRGMKVCKRRHMSDLLVRRFLILIDSITVLL